MNLFIHNMKVAFRNLMKYKLQTLISVLSIAVGIVTLAFVVSVMKNGELPAIYHLPYADRIYSISFRSPGADFNTRVNIDILRQLKQNGGLKCADEIVMPTAGNAVFGAHFILADSSQRRGTVKGEFIDPQYLEFAGFRSAIDGRKISRLKPGQAIIGERLAEKVFEGKNPIGAVQIMTGPVQPIPVTVVDIYRHMKSFNRSSSEDALLYCVSDPIEDTEHDLIYTVPHVYVVLKEGHKESELIEEVNDRVKPLGLEPMMSPAVEPSSKEMYLKENSIVYLMGTLILLAAIIGFLRIQSQLFTIRQRELTLRMVNGANLRNLFSVIFTETAISILASVILAVCFGFILKDYLSSRLDLLFNDSNFFLSELWPYCLSIGGSLVILCSIMAFISLLRIRRDRNGLVFNLRKGRRHPIRNIMLSLQIAICLMFVGFTLISLWYGEMVLKVYRIPNDDSLYDECLLLQAGYAVNPEALLQELSEIPDLDRIMMFQELFYGYEEVFRNPDLSNTAFRTYCTTDTALISFLGLEVDWIGGHSQNKECLIIGEDLYNKLEEGGVLENKTLTMGYKGAPTLHIAGKFRNMPYFKEDELIIAVTDQWDSNLANYILIPRPGRAKALAKSVRETVNLIESENIQKDILISNFRNRLSTIPAMVASLRTSIGILALVSLLICSMSIFSIIALDTRSRMKEVAIRKVNGAKRQDIYRLFGKAYLIVTLFATVIALPIFKLLTRGFNVYLQQEISESVRFYPILLFMIGAIGVIALIFAIVFWQIHRVMQTDPAKIIAKE